MNSGRQIFFAFKFSVRIQFFGAGFNVLLIAFLKF